MQRRLLISTLAVAVAAVLLLGMPLGFLVARQRTNEATQQVRHDATLLATGLQDRVDAGLPPDAGELAKSLSDRYVIIDQHGGGRTTVGTSPPPHDSITGRDSTRDFTVTVVADDSLVAGQVADGLVDDRLAGRCWRWPWRWDWPCCRRGGWPGRCRNWPAPRTGSAPATPARWGAGTGCRNSTGWRNGWTGPRSGSTTC